ncbi:MAG TPA: glutathione S-transferase family protein [Allosphingosinicella sp.]|nr:glutathione S-transferase family protein [Allosphingosinicella sp.]
MRKLYYDPASTVCRPIIMFLAEHELEMELVHVDLTLGEHLSDWYAAVNPNRLVPVLDDNGFVITESATIMRYLALAANSEAYPTEPRLRARVDEALDWFNTGFYRDFGYGVVYPQILPHYRVDEAQLGPLLDWHSVRAQQRFSVLDNHMLRDGGWVAGKEFSIADMFGAALVTLVEMIGFDLAPYPNVRRWLEAVKSRPSWGEANAAFYGWRSAVREQRQAA